MYQSKSIDYRTIEPQAQKMNKIPSHQSIQFEAIINNNATKVLIDLKTLKADKIQINVYDMIGLIQSEVKENELSYIIYYYPKRKKLLKNTQRYLQKMEFQVKQLAGWEQIRLRIISRIYNRPIQASLKLLIFYNPVSGSNSKKHLDNILSFIKFTNIQPEIVRTNHRNHCIEYLKNHQKNGEDGEKEYCGVAIVSGDGLMHQYVNSFCQIPVTHVPAGSGNAFAKTQMHYAGELCKDEESIFLVIKNNTRKFHLVKYELEQRAEPIYSFLSLQWAMIADLDVNSEFLRCLGGLRFQIYAAWLILKHKRYLGKLSYSTIQYQMPPFNIELYANPNYHVMSTYFSHTIFCLIPFISEKHKIAPLIRQDQNYIDMQAIQYEAGRYQLLKYLLSSESGSHFDLKEERPSPGYKFMHRKVRSFRLEPMDENQMGVFCIDGQMYEAQRLQASLSDKFFRAFV